MHEMMNGTSMMGMCVFLFLLFMIITVAITFLVVHFLLKNNNRLTDRSLMILRETYAKGEINDEQYEQRWKLLNRK
ncbi:SHOCT domain-containing protein [Bacillus changyiensis]|uniref:SHOCT domain-containing protein n=1 Tax=Bacillus changyiensis TaxID=3004103 RepID=UPI0022E89433|nr:SHOCT domain-containing protein [Bacillus changyiensis]MDA1475174.1 SHOCT domain-containing protein [Bacillus changyiensis]